MLTWEPAMGFRAQGRLIKRWRNVFEEFFTKAFGSRKWAWLIAATNGEERKTLEVLLSIWRSK